MKYSQELNRGLRGAKAIRRALGLSVRDITAITGKTVGHWRKVEYGEIDPPGKLLACVAKSLCCTVEELMEGGLSEARLKLIKADYLEHLAAESRAAADQAAGKAVGQ